VRQHFVRDVCLQQFVCFSVETYVSSVRYSSLYSSIAVIISNNGLPLQQYADDRQLFISLTPHTFDINRAKLEGCLHELQSWLCFKCLSLKADKSECIFCSTAERSQRSGNINPVSQIHFINASISLSDTCIKTLGVTHDSHLIFNCHIQFVCRLLSSHSRPLHLLVYRPCTRQISSLFHHRYKA
jgi:hypothetical protein